MLKIFKGCFVIKNDNSTITMKSTQLVNQRNTENNELHSLNRSSALTQHCWTVLFGCLFLIVKHDIRHFTSRQPIVSISLPLTSTVLKNPSMKALKAAGKSA